MIHSYEARAAKAVGVHAAVLLHDMAYWCVHNMHNNRHFHDGRYWTYNTCKAFTERYEYMSKGMVERAIKKLVDNGYVVVGNFNKDQRDRTRWFAVTEEGYALDRNDEVGIGTNIGYVCESKDGKPEPPDTGADITAALIGMLDPIDVLAEAHGKQQATYTDECREVIDYLREKSGNKTRHVDSNYAYIRALLRGDEPVTVDDMKAVIDVKSAQWRHDPRMSKYLRPKTLFCKSHFFDYLSETGGDRHDDDWRGGW